MTKKQSSLQLQAEKPTATQLNKKLILLIFAILVIVILLVVTFALSSSPNGPGNVQIQSESTQMDNSKISALPTGYQDADKIHAMMKRGAGDGSASQLQAELAALKAQQASLIQQVASLKQQGPGQNPNSPMQQEAMTSSVFFPGGAPAQSNQPAAAAATAGKAATDASATKPAGSTDAYSQQNMQAAKLDFLNSKPSKDIYNDNSVQYPVSKYELQASTVIPAILQTELNSDVPGVIIGVVSQNVYDSISGQYLLIPKGSKIMGQYSSSVAYGQSQLQAVFTRIIRPDGTSMVLPEQTVGADSTGVSGFQDEVNNHWGAVIGAGALMALFNLPAIVATNQMATTTTQTCNSDGTNCTNTANYGSLAAASALQSVGQATSSVGSSIANRSLNMQPTIVIHSGYQFGIIVTKDIVLPPYQTTMEDIPSLGN